MTDPLDVRAYNRRAWDLQVQQNNRWTQPVTPEQIAAARRGDWQTPALASGASVVLTENLPIPRDWLGEVAGRDVLCLASGGGQQGPILAAAGARVTVYDNSPRQLDQDRRVAEREGLALATLEGDMRRLDALADASFDLIVHPVSNLFVPEVRPVWAEAYRVLRHGGALLAGFNHPAFYIFDAAAAERGELVVRFPLPYSDLESLPEAERQTRLDAGWPLEWSHTLADLIGGQLDAGFVLTGFYEDRHSDHPLSRFMGTYMATRALKR
jgi:SAM-dependent methyltransferase